MFRSIAFKYLRGSNAEYSVAAVEGFIFSYCEGHNDNVRELCFTQFKVRYKTSYFSNEPLIIGT